MARSVKQKPWTPTDEKIRAATKRIVREFDPLRVILFGSCARGDATVDSDVDLLVVFDEIDDPREQAARIRRSLANMSIFKDIIVTTAHELELRRYVPGSVLASALREGKTVYERR
jgi:predicted nucleotidyltransferase